MEVSVEPPCASAASTLRLVTAYQWARQRLVKWWADHVLLGASAPTGKVCTAWPRRWGHQPVLTRHRHEELYPGEKEKKIVGLCRWRRAGGNVKTVSDTRGTGLL